MTKHLLLPHGRSIFREDEPVIQSHPMLEGAKPPRFDSRECWDLNGVVRRAPNMQAAGMRVWFRDLSPDWNLMARELAMVWLNPRHPAVLARGLHLGADPLSVVTVAQRMGHLRAMAAFGSAQGLPTSIDDWSDADFQNYVTQRCETGEATSALGHVHLIKALYRFRHALASGGLQRDPWAGISTNAVLNQPVVPDLKTPVIAPQTWFPLIRAAWTYISVFAPDILRAQSHWQNIQARARKISTAEADRLFRAWVSDSAHAVPLHGAGTAEGLVNWSLLSWMIGAPPRHVQLFGTASRPGRERRGVVEQLVAAGRTQVGLVADLIEVSRPDGSRGPWHHSLQPHSLWLECVTLRNACYVFVAALSMMRDCEIREIVKGAVVEHHGTPAVKSTKRKLDPDLPTKHWWITTPVAEAIDIASQLSQHDELAFASASPRSSGEGFVSGHAVTDFLTHVNRSRHVTGLAEIPQQNVTPHMFRRTLAMLTKDFPGSEIAVGMQLKHAATRALANRTTQGYMDHDPSWARHLDTAIAERRFQRLKDLYISDSHGESIGYGPGAERMREAFAAVRQQAEILRSTGKAQRGDIRVEFDLLRRTRISIRFGKLNHCTMNDADPVGAKCLEDAVVPQGHRGPLLDRCQPSRCANSVLGPEHLPIWRAERSSLLRLLDTPKIPKNRRALLGAQLQDVELMIKRADQ
ncbi:hypothetical protein OG723_25850 [Streptomyces sp. NBC_01278]|uniref:hypothetical protein n=1 Tax=Streptomyces sp. NBC_01278 TaxID=2903809 RepID=UPI002E3314F8|nr:hypothetical protein [Streptomyces sp. NBC_01278]